MASFNKNASFKEWQEFIREIYGIPNDRHFNAHNMLININRFLMRSLKGIRKKDRKKIENNLVISFSWFTSLMNQLYIDIDEIVWKRFPFQCSYCASCPCSCKEKKVLKRKRSVPTDRLCPKKLSDFQEMIGKIYPSEKRTLEQAGIHLAEEMGELSEAMMSFEGNHDENTFKYVELEAADWVTCFFSALNSLDINLAEKLAEKFYNNCHICHKVPCQCDFKSVVNFKS